MKDLTGRVAVVTGGASGIGRGMAERFAASSMRVVVADVEEPPLHETVQSIRADGGEATGVVCDVSSWSSVEALRDACTDAYGPADVLCNNAGVAGQGAVAEASLKTWEWCLGVNLWGVIHGCRAFLPAMIEQGSGHVVNTASVLGHLCSPGVVTVQRVEVRRRGAQRDPPPRDAGRGHRRERHLPVPGPWCPPTSWTPSATARNGSSTTPAAARSTSFSRRGRVGDDSQPCARSYKHAMDPSLVGDMVRRGDRRRPVLAVHRRPLRGVPSLSGTAASRAGGRARFRRGPSWRPCWAGRWSSEGPGHRRHRLRGVPRGQGPPGRGPHRAGLGAEPAAAKLETVTARVGVDLASLETAEGDIRDAGAVTAAVDGCDAVVHAAAVVSIAPTAATEVSGTNFPGALNVLGGRGRRRLRPGGPRLHRGGPVPVPHRSGHRRPPGGHRRRGPTPGPRPSPSTWPGGTRPRGTAWSSSIPP